MRSMIVPSVHTDAEVRVGDSYICMTHFGYVADPHTAIAYLGGSRFAPVRTASAVRHSGTSYLFLATAHPAKFREVVEPVIGTTVPIPPALADALARPRLSTRISPTTQALIKLL